MDDAEVEVLMSITMIAYCKWERIFKNNGEKIKYYYRTYEDAYRGALENKVGENGRIK